MSEFKLRNIEEKDIDTIYKHIHQSFVNKYFKNEREQRELHNKKYVSIIHSPSYLFHIFEDNSDNFIALISYNFEKEEPIVAIYLNREFRGKNYSKRILKTSIQALKKVKKEILNIEAYILEENIISKKIFSSLGFEKNRVEEKNGLEYLVFRKRLSEDS